ncbi:hypothetical protein [Syntrophomonas palmitatica]|uniref:hypothetical protein n=1 Tax=Syntrophomonas palmitatica TaxID=402877 RepID=UPI0006D14E30|nr:hypothetical protein [Syntrophomonas palmitatica]
MDNNELLEKDLKEEKRLFEEILQLSAQQVALFNPNQNNTDELLHNFNELLARRQTLMECVDDIEKRWDWQSESARAIRAYLTK